MKNKYRIIESIVENMRKISERPSEAAVTALAEACHEMREGNLWDDFGYSDKIIITEQEALTAVCIKAFLDDRTDILDVFNQPGTVRRSSAVTFAYTYPFKELFYHVIAAVLNHTHTETIKHILNPDMLFINYINNKIFSAAVYSGNYPIAKFLQEVRRFDINTEMIKELMENKKYEELDLLLDKGRFLWQSDLIRDIVVEAASREDREILGWIDIMAERYALARGKSQSDFLAESSDIDKIISVCMYECINGRYPKGAKMVLEHFIGNGIKLRNISKTIVACALNSTDEFLKDCLPKFIDEGTCICFEDLISEDKNSYKDLKALVKTLPRPLRLVVGERPAEKITEQDASLLKALLKHCHTEPLSCVVPLSVIDDVISADRYTVIKSLLAADALTQSVTEEIVDMCIVSQSYKCLNEINKSACR